MRDASVIEVDLSAVAHNMGVLRRIVGSACALCPIVKADGYGLGAVRIARCLLDPSSGGGADMLAVYTPDQAAELVLAAIGGPVLVLMPVREIGRADDLYRSLICGRLHLSVHDGAHLDDLVRLTERYAVAIPVHLEVDTGMSRGGCDLAEAPDLLNRIDVNPRLQLAGIYTHFADSHGDEELTDRQDAEFERLIKQQASLIPRDCIVHAANTCATIRDRKYHKSMVRVGQAWAGYGPECISSGRIIAESEHLQPSVTWSSSIVQLKTIEEGTTVGYGSTWTAKRQSLIGLIPTGYADGYPHALSGSDGRAASAKVGVILDTPGGCTREYAPVVGAVNMDQITIDLTDVVGGTAGGDARLGVGTPIELITPDRDAPNHLVALAAMARTNPYEILCRLNPRIRRVYHQAAATVEVFSPSCAAAAVAS